jgi:hypothetical protein
VQVFLDAQTATAAKEGGLRLAAFWVGVRQEFHKSFIKQRVFQFDLSCYVNSTYRSLNQAEDFTWTNRAILHCAGALTYCSGTNNHTIKMYEQLWNFKQSWQQMTPSTFNPIYCREPGWSKGEVFTELWYLDDRICMSRRPYTCGGPDPDTSRSDRHSALASYKDPAYCVRPQRE